MPHPLGWCLNHALIGHSWHLNLAWFQGRVDPGGAAGRSFYIRKQMGGCFVDIRAEL